MSSDIAIQVSNVSKYYQIYDKPIERLKQSLFRGKRQYYTEFKALDNVSFEVKKGETVGIIGRNGSGKSTLLQMICGTLTPTSGEITFNGRVAALLELGAGFNPEFTGRENIYMNAAILGLSRKEIDAKYDDIVAFADIGEHIGQPVKTYSSGMYVRLAFAVVAHVDADILVIDEALAVGDVFFMQKCMRFLREFQKEGTVVFVSHDTGAVVNLCDKVVWLYCGVMQQIGKAKDVCESYTASHYLSTEAASASAHVDINTVAEINKFKDMRMSFINSTNLRNDIKVFRFSDTGKSFGNRNAKIIDARLTDIENNPLSWIVGGELVRVVVEVQAIKSIHKVIIGFFIKDRLGQVLFGDNTYLDYSLSPVSLKPYEQASAIFSFNMPILPQGNYTADIAIADGVVGEHEQLEWIHDAFVLESQCSSVSTGLIGVPMVKIELCVGNFKYEGVE